MNYNCEDNIKKGIGERLAACERTVEPMNSYANQLFLKEINNHGMFDGIPVARSLMHGEEQQKTDLHYRGKLVKFPNSHGFSQICT